MELTADVVLFATATVLGATLIVLHLLVVWFAVRPGARAGAIPRTLAVLVPPLAPVVAWRAGRRVAAVLWALVVIAYVAVRVAYTRT